MLTSALLSQLVGRRGECEVHQAASFHVERAAIVEGERSGGVQIIDERLASFRRYVAVHQQSEIEVGERIGRPDAVKLDLAWPIREVRLRRLATRRQSI